MTRHPSLAALSPPLSTWLCFRKPLGQDSCLKLSPTLVPHLATTLGLTALVDSRAPEASASRLPLALLPRWGEEEGESSM